MDISLYGFAFFSGIFGRRFELDISLQSNIEHKEKQTKNNAKLEAKEAEKTEEN